MQLSDTVHCSYVDDLFNGAKWFNMYPVNNLHTNTLYKDENKIFSRKLVPTIYEFLDHNDDQLAWFYTLRPRPNNHNFKDEIFKYIFFMKMSPFTSIFIAILPKNQLNSLRPSDAYMRQ